jgi:hypothetical protein
MKGTAYWSIERVELISKSVSQQRTHISGSPLSDPQSESRLIGMYRLEYQGK